MKQHKPQAARGSNPAPGPGRGEAIAPACGNCCYFEADERIEGEGEQPAQRIGSCFRYPVPARKRAEMWCGEFKPAERASS